MHGPDTTLTGRKVRLRHPRWSDFEDWAHLRLDSRESLAKWEPDWDENVRDRRLFKQRLGVYRKLASAGTAYPFHVFDRDNRLVGACNLAEIKRAVARSAQIGYWIGTAHTRRGYGLEAVELATEFAFRHLGLHRVEAAVQDANTASVRLLEKAGYRAEGVARGYLNIGGQWRDHRIYAKLSSD